jgi:hypothetical protein
VPAIERMDKHKYEMVKVWNAIAHIAFISHKFFLLNRFMQVRIGHIAKLVIADITMDRLSIENM